MCTAKWHGCPVVVPQAYVRYKRNQAFLTSENANSLSNKVFLSRKPSRDLRGQASATLRADHCRQLIPPRTPKARVAAELSLRACTLREQHPGARGRAPRQKGAHTEHQPRPRWMDNGALADANKVEAATTSWQSSFYLARLRTINSLVDRVTYSWHVLVRLPFSNFVPTKSRNGKREIARSIYGRAH